MEHPHYEPYSFHIQEYIALRANILSLIEQVNQVEKYVVVGTAIVYGWLAVNSSTGGAFSHNMFWFLPLFFTILGSLKVYMLKRGVLNIGGYLNKLEQTCGLDGMGWEHYRDEKLGVKGKPSQSYLIFSYAFWVTLYVSNLIVPIFVMMDG